jgi:chaperone modulatory protein CbpM
MDESAQIQAELLTEGMRITLDELAAGSGFTMEDLRELIEYGVFSPEEAPGGRWTFSATCLARARRAKRLREAFDLDLPALSLMIAYLERIDELEQRLRQLECRLLR